MTASSSRTVLDAFVRILGAHGKRDSTARGELRGDDCFARRARFDEVVKNPIRDRFVERALVPIGRQVKFQGLALDAQEVRHVINIDSGEIGLAGHRTNRSEIIGFKMDPVIPAWRRIRECLKTGLSW